MKMHCYALWLEGGGGMEVTFCVINWTGLRRSDFIGLYILSACWPEMIDEKSEGERFHV